MDWTSLINLWHWLQKNDVPNSVAVLFTAILWPIALIVYDRRRARRVPGLEVSLNRRDKIKVDNNECPGICLRFVNKTGSVVYLHNPRLLGCTKKFVPHERAQREILESSYELKFKDLNRDYSCRQLILQTDGECESVLPMEKIADPEMLMYKPSFWRRVFSSQKYFKLEFLAVVDARRYNVQMYY